MNGNSKILLMVCFCLNALLLVSDVFADDYEQAAVLQGSRTVSSGNINNTETAQAIEWTSSLFDPVFFAHSPTEDPHQLTILYPGDYLISTTVPMNSNVQRSCIRSQVYINGTAFQGSIGESSYIRSAGSPAHNHSSSHSAVLVPNLGIGDVLEVRLLGTAYSGTTTISDAATMYVEYIDSDDRMAFAATTTRTIDGTNINSNSTYAWTAYRSDVVYDHNDTVDSDVITIRDTGTYLLTANIPQQSNVQRANAALEVELNGLVVPGGESRQGYIRSYSGHNNASIHWSGLIQVTTPNSLLRIKSWQEAAAGTVVVPSGSQGSLFLEQLMSEDVFFARGRDTTAGGNWNQTTPAYLQFTTQNTVSTDVFSHSETVNPHQVTVLRDGYYIALFQSGLYSTSQRPNPGVRIELNGAALPGAEVKTHYIRASSGHNESSGSLFFPLGYLSGGDVLSMSVVRRGSAGTVTANQDALFAIVKRPDRTPPPQPIIQFPEEGEFINEATITISGVAEAQALVEVFSDVDGSLGQTSADSAGNWTLVTAAALAEGAHRLTADAEDNAGNTSSLSTSINISIDTIAPTVPLIILPIAGPTNDPQIGFSGTGEVGAFVEIYEDTQLIESVIVDAEGVWQLTTNPLSDESYSFRARSVDLAGNVSSFSPNIAVRIDTESPDDPVLLSPYNGLVIGHDSPIFRGTAEPGAIVDILLDSTVLATVAVDPQGTWQYSHADRLVEGLHIVSAQVTDAAQNRSGLAASAAIQVLGLRTVGGLAHFDGTPLEHVTINAGSLGSFTTNSNGRFIISDVLVGTVYSIEPELAGYEFNPHAVAGTVSGNIDLEFQAMYQSFGISGQVLDEFGSPLVGALIDAGLLGTTSTDEQGRYSFPNVLYGTNYSLSASKYGYTITTQAGSGTLEDSIVVPFVASKNNYLITGRILQNSGPIAGARVDVGPLGTVYTNPDGYFRIDGVPFGSEYSVTPYYSTLVFVPSSVSGLISGNTELQFTAELGFTLSGKVTNQSKPVEGARVTLYPQNDSEVSRVRLLETNSLREATSDDQGYYYFEDVLPGSYEVTADKNGVTLDSSNHHVVIPETVGGNGGSTTVYADLEVDTVRIENPVFALWNGFIGMVNILELVNKGEDDLYAIVSLYSMSGSDSESLLDTVKIYVPGKQQRDIILNDLAGFRADSYGMLKIEFSGAEFDGRLVKYRPKQEGGGYDFVLSSAFANLSSGASNLIVNTFFPAQIVEEVNRLTFNWLSIANPNSISLLFSVHYYNQSGIEQAVKRINVPPMGRVDVDGGHGVLGHNATGQIEIRPSNSSAPYLASLSRFGRSVSGDEYSLGVNSESMRPNNAVQYLPLTNLEALVNIVEISNCSDASTSISMVVRDHEGRGIDTLDIALNPRATVHVPASSLLHGEPAGILSIDPSDDGALRIKGLEYTFDSNGKLSHALSVDSYEPFASELSGSFNLYLGMANWLRLANVSGEAQSLVISMHTAWGSISRHVELSGYGRVDLPLHDDREYSLGPDTYGVISIAGAGPGSCIAQLIRQGFDGPNLDFSVATSVR